MVKRRNRPRFTFDPFIEALVRLLDRNIAYDPRIVGAIDFTHPAGA
jgi:hypothetical protein